MSMNGKSKKINEHEMGLLRNVARQMEADAHAGDYTAIEELLHNVSTEELEAFLSDHRSPDWAESVEVSEDPGDDIESDIHAQDTWKNDWRKSEEMLNKYFDGDLNYLEEIMDHVTSDSYKYETGNDYFWDKHADIINDNFYGDWNWLEAIQYWDEKDIDQAKREWSNDLQKNQNVKPGNSSFDDRRRTTEAEVEEDEVLKRLKHLINFRT